MSDDWRRRRACTPADTPLFFSIDEADVAAAKAICAGCSVRPQCRKAGKGQAGVWGGQTLAERESVRVHKPSRQPNEQRPFILPKRPCAVCDAPFWPYSENARFCPECRALGLVRTA